MLVGFEDVGAAPRAVVPDGSVFQTSDWVRWKSTLEFTSGMLKDVVWGAGQFIMVSGDFDSYSRRYHSVAIVTLTSEDDRLTHAKNLKTNVTRHSLRAITWDGGQFVAVGNAGTILRKVCSPDLPDQKALPAILLLLLEH